ncbi:hypothetical protein C7B65_14105 [Phormidesmis priestleyi ULC007]|uniref:Uncharacterized protein n=2 Tax=Phormidesmis priestleyi TaxID=268141 RepID=A0A2T1DDW8_9CYAN|nr:hypothetical protein C7B65_14105 [Phormidesmis priestleyi ULC007]PZO51582.1 MAG: hypothetical protein DCF14_08765 [Phormidesmis priestleyi]
MEWYGGVWKLSSVFYESIPASRSGAFFRHLQEMFEVHAPDEFLVDVGVDNCIRAIGYYCRILCQLENYGEPEFNQSICSVISTNYGREKVYGAAKAIYGIAKEVGYPLKVKVEDYDLYDADTDHAFLVSHAIYYALGDILKHHEFTKPAQRAAVDFYHSLIRFVIYSGTKNHKLIPSYVTSKLANLLSLILSQPTILTLPDRDDFRGREYLNESAPSIYEDEVNYLHLSQDLSLAAAPIEDLIEQLQNRGVTVEVAQKRVAEDLATQAQNNRTMQDKLVKWSQSLGDAAVSDVVKGIVKLAIRSLGIPLP